MNKRKVNKPEPEPEHSDYEFAQVLPVARTMFALSPFEGVNKAVSRAFDFLDEAKENYLRLLKIRQAKAAEHERLEKQYARLEGSPDIVPYRKAVGVVMNSRHFDDVLPRFEGFVRESRWLKISFEQDGMTAEEKLVRWSKKGIPRRQVEELLYVYGHERQIEGEPKTKPKRRKKSQ